MPTASDADLAAWKRASPESRFGAFRAMAPYLDDVPYWWFLAATWLHGGDWCGSYYHRLFLGMFSSPRPFRHCLMTPPERAALRNLPERVTVYRGYGGEEVPAGISWTLDPTTAEQFAQDFAHAFPGTGPARVVKGTCNRWDIICYFNGRGEEEIVVDPERVKVAGDFPIG